MCFYCASIRAHGPEQCTRRWTAQGVPTREKHRANNLDRPVDRPLMGRRPGIMKCSAFRLRGFTLPTTESAFRTLHVRSSGYRLKKATAQAGVVLDMRTNLGIQTDREHVGYQLSSMQGFRVRNIAWELCTGGASPAET